MSPEHLQSHHDFTASSEMPRQIYDNGLKDWQSYIQENNLTTVPSVVMDATSKCDYGECPACYFMDDEGQKNPNRDLDLKTVEVWKRIFLETNTIPQQIWLPGGEPTLNPQLIEIINSLKEAVPEVTLVTNGFNLADREFATKILTESKITEIDITLNSANADIHNLLMASVDNPEWQKIPPLPFSELIKNVLLGKTKMSNFHQAYQALLNISQISAEQNRPLIVGINLNMNQAADLALLVEKTITAGGRLDYVMLQSMQPTTRSNLKEKNNRSFAWQKPTKEMIQSYIEQAKQLITEGKIKAAAIIDPLPDEIVEELQLNQEEIYQPNNTPAIGVDGKLRTNVLI